MKLIVGLGNPGRDYAGTRHNIGFEVIQKLSYDHNIEINRAKFRAHFGEGRIGGEKVILARPQTFMNLSGEAVRDIMAFYRIPQEDLIVVYDDVSLAPGAIRVRETGSAGGHNGIKNLLYHLETDEFLRVRVGIGEKPPGLDLADYVLSKFKPNEMEDIISGITQATDAVELILREGAKAAMNKYNKKQSPPKDEKPTAKEKQAKAADTPPSPVQQEQPPENGEKDTKQEPTQ